MPLPLLAAGAIKYGPAILKGLGGLIGANQARQDARGAAGAANRAQADANARYAERAPFRALGQQRLTQPRSYDFSADYAKTPQYRSVSDPLANQAFDAQSRSLKSLSDGPDRMSLVRQALADFDATDLPRREQGIRRIGQRAATLGRVGNEGVGTEIGNFELAAEGERERMKNSLLRDAIESGQQDKYNTARLAGDIGESAFGRAAGERSYGDTLSMNEIGLNERRRDREFGRQDADFSQGMSLSELGFGGTPDAVNQWQAERLDRSADANSGAVGQIAQSFGDLLGQRGGPPAGLREATASAGFRPTRQNIPQVRAIGGLPDTLDDVAPWRSRRGTVTAGPLR